MESPPERIDTDAWSAVDPYATPVPPAPVSRRERARRYLAAWRWHDWIRPPLGLLIIWLSTDLYDTVNDPHWTVSLAVRVTAIVIATNIVIPFTPDRAGRRRRTDDPSL